MSNFDIPQETHPERLFALKHCTGVVLDLGCGAHKTIDSAVGVDVRPVSDITSSIDALPFEDEIADTIVSRHSLEHMLDPVKTLKEWLRVLKPDGQIVVVLPDHEFINTIDPYYSAGEHLHAYTRDSFMNLASLFNLCGTPETVLEHWSFGVVLRRLPRVSILIPTLGREEGLRRCLESIYAMDYPDDLVQVFVDDGEGTVPEKVKRMYGQCDGEVIVYAANDMEFSTDCLRNAVQKTEGLVSFNAGELYPDNGNICEHFLIRRSLVSKLEKGEIFSTDFHHTGCDNWLWAQATQLGEAARCETARITHHHFSKGAPVDEIYQKGWAQVDQDRQTLTNKLKLLSESHERGNISNDAV